MINLRFSSVFPDSGDWETYLLDLLFSVQSKKRVYDSLFRYFPSLFVSDIQSVLSSLHRVEYNGMSFVYRSVYTDCLKDNVLFLSSKSVDRYHEKLVSHLTSVSVLSGLSFKRRPSRSRYDGYDLELKGLNVEVETGLKASYRDLEDRIALSFYPVLVVVPNQDVLKRYSNHFRFWDVHLTSLSGYLNSVRSLYL